MHGIRRIFVVVMAVELLGMGGRTSARSDFDRLRGELDDIDNQQVVPHEQPPQFPVPTVPTGAPVVTASGPIVRGPYVSVQVNVDVNGMNIVGDAANEPTIAVDPNNPDVIVMGWRQFDDVKNNFRQAGRAYSHDGGATWTFPGSLAPGLFGSDPVLATDANGVFYYVSIDLTEMRLFRSYDGGVLFAPYTQVIPGFGDKEWMAIDNSGGTGDGFIYLAWSGVNQFTRSTDGGATFMTSIPAPISNTFWGTMCVNTDGHLFLADRNFLVVRSSDAQIASKTPTFDQVVQASLGGTFPGIGGFVNPVGLLGQPWLVCNNSSTPQCNDLYLLCSVVPPSGSQDPLDVRFARSRDGGVTWDKSVRINTDPPAPWSYQWFGTMAVSPGGRLDVVWLDTRNDPSAKFSELYYTYSYDGGITWAPEVPVTPPFDHTLGYPQQNKLGDYFGIVSTSTQAYVAYAATFNGEQDVYFLKIDQSDCNGDGISNEYEINVLGASDCDGDGVPDYCESDLDGDGVINACDDDIDGDGVPNDVDVCLTTPLAGPVKPDGSPAADRNGDCRVDLKDYALFPSCLMANGPGVEPAGNCVNFFDFNGDGAVDIHDFEMFQLNFTGPLPGG